MPAWNDDFGRVVIRPLLLVVFIVLQLIAVFVLRYDTLDVEVWPNATASPRLFGSSFAGQSFVPARNRLSRIDVMIATHRQTPEADLVFRLFQGGFDGTPLAEAVAPGPRVRDNLFHRFTFPVVRRAEGRVFTFTVSSPAADEAGAVSLWTNPADIYPAGVMILDGRPVPGDVVFRTYARRTIFQEWTGIARNLPGVLGTPFVFALIVLLFEIALVIMFRKVLGLFWSLDEDPPDG